MVRLAKGRDRPAWIEFQFKEINTGDVHEAVDALNNSFIKAAFAHTGTRDLPVVNSMWGNVFCKAATC